MTATSLLLLVARRLRRATAQALARWSERRYEAWRNSPQSHRRF